MLLQTTAHTFNYLSGFFFEVSLFHEIAWTKYQKVLIFSSRFSWNEKFLTHSELEITWVEDISIVK